MTIAKVKPNSRPVRKNKRIAAKTKRGTSPITTLKQLQKKLEEYVSPESARELIRQLKTMNETFLKGDEILPRNALPHFILDLTTGSPILQSFQQESPKPPAHRAKRK